MHVRTSHQPSDRWTATESTSGSRPTQAERSARTRSALLESAARGLSRVGYGNLNLERVAADAGYTRGALYHQFEDKEDLALAVLDWVHENWVREVGAPAGQEPDPVAELIALARGHAVFCRRTRSSACLDVIPTPSHMRLSADPISVAGVNPDRKVAIPCTRSGAHSR